MYPLCKKIVKEHVKGRNKNNLILCKT